MMNTNGYVMLERSIVNSRLWNNGSQAVKCMWVLLEMLANWKPTEVVWKGKTIVLEKGELLAGINYLADLSGLSDRGTRNVLKWLARNRFLSSESSNKGSKIKLLKSFCSTVSETTRQTVPERVPDGAPVIVPERVPCEVYPHNKIIHQISEDFKNTHDDKSPSQGNKNVSPVNDFPAPPPVNVQAIPSMLFGPPIVPDCAAPPLSPLQTGIDDKNAVKEECDMARWLMAEHRRKLKGAFPRRTLYELNERDMLTARNIILSMDVSNDSWSKLLDAWITDLSSSQFVESRDLTISAYERWLKKSLGKGHRGEPRNSKPRAPTLVSPSSDDEMRDSIGATMTDIFTSESRRDAIWTACKLWGVILTAQWLSLSGSEDACFEVKECLMSHMGTSYGRIDVRDSMSATLRWETATTAYGMAMSDWRERLSDLISQVGPFQPYPTRGTETATVTAFVKANRSVASLKE